jgi:hypothetical protein
MTTKSAVLTPLTFHGDAFRFKNIVATKPFLYSKVASTVPLQTFKGNGLSKTISNQIAIDNATRSQNDAYDETGYLPPIGGKIGNHSISYTNKRGKNVPKLSFGTQTNSITETPTTTTTVDTNTNGTPKFKPVLSTIYELPEGLTDFQRRPVVGKGSKGGKDSYKKQFKKTETIVEPYIEHPISVIDDRDLIDPWTTTSKRKSRKQLYPSPERTPRFKKSSP